MSPDFLQPRVKRGGSDDIVSAICAEIAVRRRLACEYLQDLCERTQLPELVGPKNHWAIIGGVVRDAVVRSHGDEPCPISSWPDIDIAVTVNVDRLPAVRGFRAGEVKVSRNSFGGLRLES